MWFKCIRKNYNNVRRMTKLCRNMCKQSEKVQFECVGHLYANSEEV